MKGVYLKFIQYIWAKFKGAVGINRAQRFLTEDIFLNCNIRWFVVLSWMFLSYKVEYPASI